MKKIVKSAIVAAIGLGMVSMTSCIGSFTLTNRVLAWNNHVGNKFINELVFFGLWVLPVYEICCLADVLVLNSIEFWSGNNIMAKGDKVIEGNDGRYLVRCDGKGYDIISYNDGSKTRLDFDVETQSWNYTIGDQQGTLFRFVDDSHISLPVNGGNEWQTVELSQAGLYAYQQAVMPAYAAR